MAAHSGPVKGLTFASSSKLLASSGGDGTVLVWDVAKLVNAAKAKPITLDAAELESAWQRLASGDADRAYEAIRQLHAAAKQAVPLLKDKLRPIDAGRLDKLLKDIDSDMFAVRETAQRDLENMGRFIRPAIEKTMRGELSLESRRRLERILERFDTEGATPEHLRTLRGLEILERIATDDARQVLRGIAAGAPDAELTQQAKAALTRLEKR